MSGKAQQTIQLLLLATWIAMLVQPSHTQLLPGFPGIPGLPGTSQINQCLASFNGIEGCLLSLFTFPIGGLTPSSSCCNAILNISKSCWSVFFPLAPYAPQLIQNFCDTPKAFAASPK